MAQTLDGNELLAFQAISAFVLDIHRVGGKFQRSLQLYNRLIEKTNFSHNEAIQKHVDAFRKFCMENREALLSKDVSKLETTTIEYSKRVYINARLLIKNADEGDVPVIWKHLMTISAIVDPEGKVRNVLKADVESEELVVRCQPSDTEEKTTAEDDFITNIMSKVEDSVDPTATDPSAALGQMMSGGIMGDLMTSMTSGMQDGSLDLGKLMGSLQKMVGKLEDTEGAPPELKQMTGNLNQMINTAKKQVDKHAT